MSKIIFTTILLLIILLNTTNLILAEINSVTIEDLKDHKRMVEKLNTVIEKVNNEHLENRLLINKLESQFNYQVQKNNTHFKELIQKKLITQHSEVSP